jgi:hypothetical protein
VAVQVLVNGVDQATRYTRKSLSIKNTGSAGIVTASCEFIDVPGGGAINLEHVMRVLNNGVEVFEGPIKSRKRRSTPDPGPNPKKVYNVTAQDYTILLTQDVIDATLLRTGSRTDKAEIEFLVTTYGTKGITVGALVQNTGTITRDIDYSGMNLYEAIEEAQKWMGTSFYVDSDKQLHNFVSEANAAPFNLSDVPNNTTTFGYRNLDLADDSIELVNAVWVVGTGVALWRTDAASITAYGRIENTIRDAKITTTAQANAAGDAYLALHAFPDEPITLETFKDGLKAGMTVQITNALWGIAAVTYRIQTVTAKHNGETDTLIYTVNLDSRPVDLASILSTTQRQVVAAGSAVGALETAVETFAVDLTVAGANLVPNSSFENGSAGSWGVGSVWAFGFAVADAYAGTKVARLTAVGASSGELATTDFIPIVRTDFYWVSWYSFLRSRTAGNYKVFIRQYNAAGALLATTTDTLSTVEADWTRHKQQFGPNDQPGVGTVIWNATTAKIKIAFQADTTPTGTWDVDGVQVERGKLITAYAPTPQELIDGQIGPTQLATNAVTTTKIADDAISTPKLQANSVTANEINANAVTSTKIAANAVVAGKIAAGVVTANEIAADTITAAEIAAGAVTASEIAANAVTAVKVAAEAISARNLAVGGWSGNLIINGSFEEAEGNAHSVFQTGTGNLTGWNQIEAVGWRAMFGASGYARHGSYICYVGVTAAGPSFVGLRQFVPVQPGKRYRIRAKIARGAGTAGSAQIVCHTYDKTLTAVTFNAAVSAANSSTSQADVAFEYLVPSDGSVSYLGVNLRLTGTPSADALAVFEDVIMESADFVTGSADIVLDGTGIHVTGGKIEVRNPGSTVIIDGTSNMFKIGASGTFTVAFPTAGNTNTNGASVPALGSGFTVPPMMLAATTYDVTGVSTNEPRFGHLAQAWNGGSLAWQAGSYAYLSAGVPVARLMAHSATLPSGFTAGMRYYYLVETAI